MIRQGTRVTRDKRTKEEYSNKRTKDKKERQKQKIKKINKSYMQLKIYESESACEVSGCVHGRPRRAEMEQRQKRQRGNGG